MFLEWWWPQMKSHCLRQDGMEWFVVLDGVIRYETGFFCGIGRQMLARMLWIEVQLPQQAARKKIEWNKHTDPTFQELKERLQQCGVPDDWCVEVLRGDDFLSPDVNTHITGPKITVRATPILGLHLTLSIASSSSIPSCLLVLGILCGALFSSAWGTLTAQSWESYILSGFSSSFHFQFESEMG